VKILKWLICFTLLTCSATAQDGQQWKLYYDSTQYYWAKDWNKTVSLLEHAERSAISDLGLYHQNYLTILNDLGTAYWKARDYSKAEKALSQSLDLKSEVYPLNDKEVILSISNLAGFYAEQGRWNKSKSLYNKILSADPREIPSEIYVSAAQNLVSLYDLNQQPDSADYLLRKIELWNVITANSYLYYQHQFYRARIYRKLQQYGAAEGVLSSLIPALSTRKEGELIELYIQSLQEQGVLFLETGAYSQAEKNLLNAYQLVTAERNRDYLLTELSNNLAQVYDKLNIFDKALLYYQESLGRCRLAYDEKSLPCVILQNNIAGIHLKENNVAEAIAGYQKVIAEFEKLLNPSDALYITSINNLATAYRKNNQFKLATEYLDKAERLISKYGFAHDDLASTVLNNIAVLNTAQGNYEQAALHYRNAYEIKRSIYGDNSILLIDLISNLAVAYWTLNKPQEAIPLFKKSMALATRQVSYVFPNLNENEQVQFYQKLKEDFERFNTIATQWGEQDAELIAQMFQNRTIIKSLQFFTHQRRKNTIGMKQDLSLDKLVSRLKDCRDRLGHLYQLPLNQLADPNSIATLEKEIDALEKNISMKSSEVLYGEGLTAEEVSWKSLIPKLKPNEAIVELVRFRKYERQSSRRKDYFGFADSVYYAALILTRETTEKPQIVTFKDGINLESRFYYYYKNAMKYNVEDNLSYHFFWEPIEKCLVGKTKIFLSADGVYHKINVNTLRDPESKKFLLDKFDIVYLLNPIQFLENKKPVKNVANNAVLMGDPVFDVDPSSPRERSVEFNHFSGLPGTQEELRAIDKVLKAHSWKTSLYLKGAATESNLKAVESPTILHLASHGFFSSEIVSLNSEAKKEFLFHSGIVLSGANKSIATGSTSFQNDGIVTAFEVMNLNLTNTHLVVLSACETGLGKIENGEGVFGLQRSFMQAGARNVLISLWKVDDDATRDLMIDFYQYLALGNSLHEALKKAQSDQARLVANPSLWGGFVLVGNN
jgi:CHAT domain-containing protein/tetratricopeptide (TPR) repeat protein